MINWEKEWENIERMITSGDSYESIGRKYGCTGNYIRKTAIKKGLVLPKRRKINPKETFNRGVRKNVRTVVSHYILTIELFAAKNVETNSFTNVM